MMIVAIIFAAGALLGAVIVCAPFMLEASYLFDEGENTFGASLWWLAPWFFRAQTAPPGGNFEIRFLCWRFAARSAPVAREDGAAAGGAPSAADAGHAPLAVRESPAAKETVAPPAPSLPIDGSAAALTPPQAESEDDARKEPAPSLGPAQHSARGVRARWRRLSAMKKSRLLWHLARDSGVRCGIASWILRILKAMRAVIHFELLRLHVAAHLSDPALLGVLYGYCEGARYALMPGGPIDIQFKPVFDRDLLAVNAQARIRTSLLRIAWPVLTAAATFPYLSVGLALWRTTGSNDETNS